MMFTITKERIKAFEERLYLNEKSKATVKKYIRAVQKLSDYLDGEEVTKAKMLEYREALIRDSKPQTVNGALTAIHAFLDMYCWQECRVKLLKIQRCAFIEESRELTQDEYNRLLAAAREQGNERLCLLMQTVCGTGIRISELPYITVEAARKGRAEIRMKGKSRTVLLPKALQRMLLAYTKRQNIQEGHIFRTRTGKPLDRVNICRDMKKLCSEAAVDPRKVFPHNLRHLFARTFYAIEKNIAHLADILGHSRIETTRIYVAASASAHRQTLNRMQLVIQ